jgi:hypothetical protein
MVDIVSWIGVAVIALLAVVGFTGVVATGLLTLVRTLRHRGVRADAEAPRYAPAA